MGDFNIVVEANDWKEEYDRNPQKITGIEQAVKVQMDGRYSVQRMGRMLLVGRELGDIDRDIIPDNKCVLSTGATYAYSQRLAALKKDVQIENGNTVTVREYVGNVTMAEEQAFEDDSPEPLSIKYVPIKREDEPVDLGLKRYTDPKAHQRAKDYLEHTIPGYIKGRLNIIATHGGDVTAAGQFLKEKIDDMVAKLT